jgi:hypothetical protein
MWTGCADAHWRTGRGHFHFPIVTSATFPFGKTKHLNAAKGSIFTDRETVKAVKRIIVQHSRK